MILLPENALYTKDSLEELFEETPTCEAVMRGGGVCGAEATVRVKTWCTACKKSLFVFLCGPHHADLFCMGHPMNADCVSCDARYTVDWEVA